MIDITTLEVELVSLVRRLVNENIYIEENFTTNIVGTRTLLEKMHLLEQKY